MCLFSIIARFAPKKRGGFGGALDSAHGQKLPRTPFAQGGGSGPVQSTATPLPIGRRQPLTPAQFKARGMLQNNRNQIQVQAYVATHLALQARGIYSDE
jgi:hypothetical protein